MAKSTIPAKTAEAEIICPKNRKAWRQWLQKNHAKKQSVWVIYYKVGSGQATMSWSDAVDEALCFGWIDSTRRTVDEARFKQFFAKRKPKSTWSRINKEKIKRLINEGLMSEAGLAAIETAKKNGSWNTLDHLDNPTIPPDLSKELKKHPGAKKYFEALTPSYKRIILQWLLSAKRPETRQKRIVEIATNAAQQLRPKQFR